MAETKVMPQRITDIIPVSQVLFGGMLVGGLFLGLFLILALGPMGLAALVAAAVCVILVFTHPLVPFTVYFGALFFEDTTLPGLPVSINQLVAPLFILSVITYAIRGKTLPLKFSLLPLLVVVTMYFGINGLLGENFENGLLYSRYVVVYLVIAVCIAVTMSREHNILALAWVIVVHTGIAAGAGVYEAFEKDIIGKFTGNWGYQLRVQGTAANPIVYGWNMVFAFPFAFLLFGEMRSRFTRGLAIFLGMLVMAAATLTFNRQTFVVIGVSVALCTLLYAYRNRTMFLTALSIFAAIAAFTVMPLILQRFLTVAELTTDYSFLERKDSVQIGIEMLKQHPIFGVGFGSYPKEWRYYLPADYSTYFAQYRAPQQDKFMDLGFMQILVETGIIGLVFYLTVIVAIFIRSYRYRRAAVQVGDRFGQNLSSTAIVLVVIIALTSLIQDTFLYTRVWIFYGIAMLLDQKILPVRNSMAPDHEQELVQQR